MMIKGSRKILQRHKKIFGLCYMWGELILILIRSFCLLENGPWESLIAIKTLAPLGTQNYAHMDSNSPDLATFPKVGPPTILKNKLCLGELSQRLLLILLCSFEQSSHVQFEVKVEVQCFNFMPFGWMQSISCSGGYRWHFNKFH